jgi:hypothetical protein
VSLKLATVALILGLLMAQAAPPSLAVAGGLVGILLALVVSERALIP